MTQNQIIAAAQVYEGYSAQGLDTMYRLEGTTGFAVDGDATKVWEARHG